mgnify:CR=1 FL=1
MRPDDHLGTYLELLQLRSDVQAVLLSPDTHSHVSCRAGTFCLIVVNQPPDHLATRCLHVRDKLIVEHPISVWELEQGVAHGLDERMVSFLLSAEVIWEKDGYFNRVKTRLCRVPDAWKKKQLCREYSRILRFYYEIKAYVQQGMILDAYHVGACALQAWARYIVYEAGELPSVALWTQVKQLEPSVFKLYEELSLNAEMLDKRIELLVLAIEFWLSTSLKESVGFLLEIMAAKTSPWKISDLMLHPEVREAGIEIPLLLEKMVQRFLVQEVLISTENPVCKEIGFILLE